MAGGMLARENERFRARQAEKKPPAFSSPVPKNGSITQIFTKSQGRVQASTNTKYNGTAEPSNNRAANMVAPPASRASGFGSICGQSGSFKEEVIVLDENCNLSAKGSKTSSTMYITADDFSDDDALDLNFDAIPALTNLPKFSGPADDFGDADAVDLNFDAIPVLPELPKVAGPAEFEPRPAPQTSELSWSQSPPSHLHPPACPPAQTTTFALKKQEKRKSLEEEGDGVVRKATKRELPPQFLRRLEEAEVMVTKATPARKKVVPWDLTASGIKEQTKQLKQRQKSSGPDSQGGPAEAAAKNSAISLSKEQRHVLDLVVQKGQSVFFTGPAGTGKSVLMRSIIQELKKRHKSNPERVAVTASTGLAACNIGGSTLHSFAGIGLGKDDVPTLIKKIRRNPKNRSKWLKTKILIIDEISMVDGDLFDKLSQIGRTLRNNGRPWGGIQLVITGDFFQLPPVPDFGKMSKFAFEAATWKTSIDHTIGLTEVFRQRDPEFARMLNEMRLGRISDSTVQNFKALSRDVHFGDGVEITELFPMRHQVDRSNEKRLTDLPGQAQKYPAIDTGDPMMREKLLSNVMAPPYLELKKGAQVMLIKNMDETLVNGSIGTVVGFTTEASFTAQYGDDVSGNFGLSTEAARKRSQLFNSKLEAAAAATKDDTTLFPVVMFHTLDGGSRTILCGPEEWKIELPTGEVQACRKQLPLILAWALSIHKAQGQTLERVKVDLGKTFEKGQAYVALSRATTQQGLQVLHFSRDKVMAHPKVVGFYNMLYSAESALSKKDAQPTIMSFAYTGDGDSKKTAPPKDHSKKAPDKSSRTDGEMVPENLNPENFVPGNFCFSDDEEAMMAAYG